MSCYNACRFSSISMLLNDWGELIPAIDEERCTGCGRCTAACPVLQGVSFDEPLGCYAAWAYDSVDRSGSSSGGIATVLAKQMISRGGIVVGVAFDESATARHFVADSAVEVERFRSSKYVFSQVGLSYRGVQGHLKAGRAVLFVGCPCQVAGLLAYLGDPHEGLVTVDLVCHGAPPGRYLEEHLAHVTGGETGVLDVSFRAGGRFRLRVRRDKKVVYNRSEVLDSYYYSFMKAVSFREACYSCRFASVARCSDITLGDFWGLDRTTLRQDDGGMVSLILVNTESGRSFVESVDDAAHLELRSVEEAVAGNEQLRVPSKRHPRRSAFREAYPSFGFSGALKKSGVLSEQLVVAAKQTRPARWLSSVRRAIRRCVALATPVGRPK